MRTLLLGTTSALFLSVLVAPAPVSAQGFGLVMRLSAQMGQVERLNDSRPDDEFHRAIAHQIGMINDRFADLQRRDRPTMDVIGQIDESLYAILQYNDNLRFEAPMLSMQIRRIVREMRAELLNLRQGGWRDRGNSGWGNSGWGNGHRGGYLPGSYVPPAPPAPRYYEPPRYVPPPPPARHYYEPPPAPGYEVQAPAYPAPCGTRPISY